MIAMCLGTKLSLPLLQLCHVYTITNATLLTLHAALTRHMWCTGAGLWWGCIPDQLHATASGAVLRAGPIPDQAPGWQPLPSQGATHRGKWCIAVMVAQCEGFAWAQEM